MDKLICVVGPTASGKTALAVRLAKALDGEVVSCDSMQIYRRMEYWMESAVEEAFGISSAEYMQDDEMGALFFLIPADSSGDYQLCVQETKELPWTQIDVVDRLSVIELGEGVRNQ
mgnify:CR=1 FL=1